MIETGVFYLFATILVAAAIGVISFRNPVYAALCLVLAFVTSSVLWILIEAEFLGIVLVLVYVGAVMVLFLFVVMMLDINTEQMREGFTRYAPLGGLVAFIVVAEIGYVLLARTGPAPEKVALPGSGYSNTEELGKVLYTDHVYAFELAAMILLVAIVAAIALTMRKRAGVKAQNISEQVATSAKDRIRMVSMPAEKR
ncbi:MAG: NADH-quinone oxidoreductase subunit J [Gammaproteobacteria bacterium]|nr:NADH-quinone oxidoreductase subunit J [Gammaproteobacteria bacterium]NNF61123.1 NADH-quinone oxidoreductase subunit J [Gammaproteobacteria bacterium]